MISKRYLWSWYRILDIFLCKPSGAETHIFHTNCTNIIGDGVLAPCSWINRWVNNGEAGDLRHHRAHYDVTVMSFVMVSWPLTFPGISSQGIHCVILVDPFLSWIRIWITCAISEPQNGILDVSQKKIQRIKVEGFSQGFWTYYPHSVVSSDSIV